MKKDDGLGKARSVSKVFKMVGEELVVRKALEIYENSKGNFN